MNIQLAGQLSFAKYFANFAKSFANFAKYFAKLNTRH